MLVQRTVVNVLVACFTPASMKQWFFVGKKNELSGRDFFVHQAASGMALIYSLEVYPRGDADVLVDTAFN